MTVVFDLADPTWTCMVCGDERPDAYIRVRHRPLKGAEKNFREHPDAHEPGVMLARVNLRYCTDRPSCTAVAMEPTSWPPPPLMVKSDDVLALTAAALTERAWDTRRELLPDVAVAILLWLRDESAPVSTFLASYDERAQDIYDACRALAYQGLVQVVVDRCDPKRRLHADPHRGCVLR